MSHVVTRERNPFSYPRKNDFQSLDSVIYIPLFQKDRAAIGLPSQVDNLIVQIAGRVKTTIDRSVEEAIRRRITSQLAASKMERKSKEVNYVIGGGCGGVVAAKVVAIKTTASFSGAAFPLIPLGMLVGYGLSQYVDGEREKAARNAKIQAENDHYTLHQYRAFKDANNRTQCINQIRETVRSALATWFAEDDSPFVRNNVWMTEPWEVCTSTGKIAIWDESQIKLDDHDEGNGEHKVICLGDQQFNNPHLRRPARKAYGVKILSLYHEGRLLKEIFDRMPHVNLTEQFEGWWVTNPAVNLNQVDELTDMIRQSLLLTYNEQIDVDNDLTAFTKSYEPQPAILTDKQNLQSAKNELQQIKPRTSA